MGGINTAGIPNLYGRLRYRWPALIGTSGDIFTFVTSEQFSRLVEGTTSETSDLVTFDASRSSAVFGGSSEVMPKSVNMKYMTYLGI